MAHKTKSRARLMAGSLSASAVLLSTWANAQDSGAQAAANIGEVVVTATKQGSASVLETPLSIQAITGDMLEDRAITDFNDFMATVPGLTAYDQGPGNKRYVLRGINGGTGAGTVALYVDEITITGEDARGGGGQQPDVKMYDMDRLEVIKGPQSTTFGSSSMSGVIRYITKKPDLSGTSGYLRGGLTSMDGADIGQSYDGAINLPLVEDKFALRLSAYYLDQPGYIDSRFQKDVNNEETVSGRIQALWQVTDTLDISLFSMYQKTETDGASFFNLVDYYGNPVSGRQHVNPERAPWEDEAWLHNITANLDIGVGKITATASRNDRYTMQSTSGSEVMAQNARRPKAALELDGIRSLLKRDKDRVIDSYELRFASDFDGPVQVLVGAIRQVDERDWVSQIPTVNSAGYIDPSAGVLYGPSLQYRGVVNDFTETAAFGQATWKFADQWALTAGLRRFKVESNAQSYLLVGTLGAPGTGYAPKQRSEEQSTIGRVNLSFEPADNVLLYAEVGEGFRVGGTNDPSLAALAGVYVPDGFGSDSLVNYELGAKTSLLDRRLSVTAAVFYIDWSDMQVQLRTATSPVFSYIGNANAAEVRGAELELQYMMDWGLTLGGSFGYTDSELVEAVTGGGRSGDQVPYTSKYSAAVSADYAWTLSAALEARVGIDANWRDKRVSDFPGNVASYKKFDAYTTVNLHGNVEFGDWTASLSVKNLLNDDTITDQYNVNVGFLQGWFENRPRTVSVMLQKQF